MATKHYVRNSYPSSGNFPVTGKNNILYEAADTGILYRWNVVTELYEPWGAGGGGAEELRYIASLTQTGTNDPVATVIQNDFEGEIVWTREDLGLPGQYIGTLEGAFAGNTRVIPPTNRSPSINPTRQGYAVGTDDDDIVYLSTFLIDNTTGEATQSDDLLFGTGFSYIEIIKYL